MNNYTFKLFAKIGRVSKAAVLWRLNMAYEREVFDIVSNGDDTQLVSDKMVASATQDPELMEEFTDLPGIEYIVELGNTNHFQDGIVERVNYLIETEQVDGSRELKKDNAADIDACIQIVKSLCREAKVDPGRNNISNWIKGERRPSSTSRDKVFQLCFALRMNHIDTHNFFMKKYLE